MGNSLRDELLKAGLAPAEQRRKPRRRKRDATRPAKRGEAPKGRAASPEAGESRESRAGARHVLRENQRRTSRFIRDASLAGPSVEENARKALRRRIEALVARERLNDDAAEVAYHFVKGKRIKRIYVTEAQRAALGAGELVIAALEGNHHLMRAAAAEELKTLAPQATVCTCVESDGNADAGEEHPVPDDISW